MTAGNEALMLAIKTAGPVAVGINANNLQFYSSGIIDAASCPPAGRGIQAINHAALVVGWGSEVGHGSCCPLHHATRCEPSCLK
jgi:hypothetical protein